MKIEGKVKYCLWLVGVNLLFLLGFKFIFFLKRFSGTSLHDLENIYPRIYKLVFWLVQQNDKLILLLVLSFFLVNVFLIFSIATRLNKTGEVILATTVMLFLLVAAEISLRKFVGYIPGNHTKVRYFTPVDSLWMMKGFEPDSNGIFKVSSVAVDEISKAVKAGDSVLQKNQTMEVYSLIWESIDLKKGKIKNEFSELYHRLSDADNTNISQLEKAIIEFVDSPVNSDGFRSIQFTDYPNHKPSVLLIGDSFTWGHSATTKSSSFSDILLARGYTVYNAGVSGTDAAQYLAVAQKYIPKLNPDFVIVNFFLGNDITYFERKIASYVPAFFPTNAGNLMACPHGVYFKNAEEAYEFNLGLYNIPEEENLFNKLMAKTVITTLTWRILLRVGLVNYGTKVKNYFDENEKIKFKKPYCNIQLQEMKKIAELDGAKFILSSIPEVYRFTFKTKKDFPDLFEGLNYVEMPVTKDDYKLDDGHFNDAGHMRYADFLIQQIEAK